jgi:hypothetical protein
MICEALPVKGDTRFRMDLLTDDLAINRLEHTLWRLATMPDELDSYVYLTAPDAWSRQWVLGLFRCALFAVWRVSTFDASGAARPEPLTTHDRTGRIIMIAVQIKGKIRVRFSPYSSSGIGNLDKMIKSPSVLLSAGYADVGALVWL